MGNVAVSSLYAIGIRSLTPADLHHTLIALQIEAVEIVRPKAWQAIVEAPRVIDRHKNVVVEVRELIEDLSGDPSEFPTGPNPTCSA
jgi:hypothetical protein